MKIGRLQIMVMVMMFMSMTMMTLQNISTGNIDKQTEYRHPDGFIEVNSLRVE